MIHAAGFSPRFGFLLHRLEVAGLGDRRDRMNPMFRAFLDLS